MPRPASRPSCAAVALFGLMGLLAAAPAARAQIFYEPVRYQYGQAGGGQFYYGGSDARVFERAEAEACRGRYGRVSGQQFSVGNVRGDFPRVNPRQTVYSDCAPYANAADAGYGANDARNEAYANVPRYFRKRDLDAAAVERDGVWVVPAQARPRPDLRPAPRAAAGLVPAKPGMILIIPKRLLRPDKPAANQVAQVGR